MVKKIQLDFKLHRWAKFYPIRIWWTFAPNSNHQQELRAKANDTPAIEDYKLQNAKGNHNAVPSKLQFKMQLTESNGLVCAIPDKITLMPQWNVSKTATSWLSFVRSQTLVTWQCAVIINRTTCWSPIHYQARSTMGGCFCISNRFVCFMQLLLIAAPRARESISRRIIRAPSSRWHTFFHLLTADSPCICVSLLLRHPHQFDAADREDIGKFNP